MTAEAVSTEGIPLLPPQQHSRRRRPKLTTLALVLAILVTALLLSTHAVDLWRHFTSRSRLADFERAQKCSIDNFRDDISFLDGARPIEAAVNTGTVAAVLDTTLLSVGFGLFFNIVLFEEHGALPHGGSVIGGKKLTHESMVVIDVDAHYQGYSSDICRSFLIDPPKHTHIVLRAQTAAAKAMRPNNTAASVDIAARTAHESPYLNKWNMGAILRAGMTFTNEPGIYLEGKFGVRHEDVYLVTKD
ncbi:Xaa-Pro dipeptidase [Tolypocladium ophioglossoides CBS 100239]|uniref:Xaa-Pro dipeptidase n=1 Tax=Tolypocladium ophioglossoides (strain CBS 100239) TaxID=1163406 RepID=A0A0L0N9B4_TOLOC|nr:Xaa-Pro dipeptidase [Tolypocladium ophioglossoides CBS 100239]